MYFQFLFFLLIIKYSSQNNKFCQCSTSSVKGKVYNGTRVRQGEFQWVVGIYSTSTNIVFCTGSLLNDNTVLTSSHCFNPWLNKNSYKEIRVLAGNVEDFKVMIDSKDGSRKVDQIIFHPKYNQTRTPIPSDNDIAILILQEKFNFNSRIQPACILKRQLLKPKDSNFYFAGYGIIKPYFIEVKTNKPLIKTQATGLNKIQLKIDKKSCQNLGISSYFYCLRNPYGSLCTGDSGGAIHSKIGDKLAIVGINSSAKLFKYGQSHKLACTHDLLSMSVLVYKHMDFIEKYGKPQCLVNIQY